MCLAALKEIGSRKSFLFLSVGTDGVDGNSKAAGAMVDYRTYDFAQKHGLRIDEYLYRNDSNGLLERAGDLIVTGPTGTNVMDITILLINGEDQCQRPDFPLFCHNTISEVKIKRRQSSIVRRWLWPLRP